MKSILLLVFFFLNHFLFAQIDTVYLRNYETPCRTKDSSNRFKTIEYTAPGYLIKTYETASGRLLSMKNTLDIEGQKTDGKSVSYYQNGNVKSELTCVNDTVNGIGIDYYESGKVHYTLTYKSGKRNGELEAFYEDGKLKRKSDYSDNREVTSICYDTLGNTMPCSDWQESAHFGNKSASLPKYLKKNIKYPKELLEGKVEGQSIVKFKVNKQGEVEEVYIYQSAGSTKAHKKLDVLALKVIESMPNWKPAKLDGENIDSYFTLPITFKI